MWASKAFWYASRQLARAAPDGEPDGTRVGPIEHPDDPLGGFRVHALPDHVRVAVVAVLDEVHQVLGRRVVTSVLQEVADDLAVGLDGLAEQIGTRVPILTVAEAGQQTLDVQVTCVQKGAHDGLLVVGVAADVRHHDDPGLQFVKQGERLRGDSGHRIPPETQKQDGTTLKHRLPPLGPRPAASCGRRTPCGAARSQEQERRVAAVVVLSQEAREGAL